MLATSCAVVFCFSDHFPARGWKHLAVLDTSYPERRFSDHFPARGWKPRAARRSAHPLALFSDHFPARGWKLSFNWRRVQLLRLFRSFPRKGMETQYAYHSRPSAHTLRLFRSFPRKGMETLSIEVEKLFCRPTFPLISPQGDGNTYISGF